MTIQSNFKLAIFLVIVNILMLSSLCNFEYVIVILFLSMFLRSFSSSHYNYYDYGYDYYYYMKLCICYGIISQKQKKRSERVKNGQIRAMPL